LKGAQHRYGVKPDLATWGKGIANGFSACALTGRADIMELGGIRREGADKLFLISTTHGAETVGLAAMIATIDEFERYGMIEANWQRGEDLRGRLNGVIARHGLAAALEVKGDACLLALICRNAQAVPDDAFRTLMMQEMIARGVLFQGLFYITWSHRQEELDEIVAAFDEACEVYRRAIENETCEGLLVGAPAKPVFRKKI
jgi:glutamate-1-semialdehyde aminotransferase